MKKRLRKINVNSLYKRVISMAIVGAMFISELPMPEIASFAKEIVSNVTITASANEQTPQPFGRQEFKKTYNNTSWIHIESWSDFVWYSQSYYDYSLGQYSNPLQHEKDVLFINIGDNIGNNYNLDGKNYVPIGNDTKPFEGRIIFSNSSAADTFNVPESLFGTISEKVTIKNQDETAVKQIKLTRVGAGNGDPLFAKKVKSDNNNTTYANWDIVFGRFNESDAVSYAGLIGEIEDSANVKVTFENNALPTMSNLLANASSTDSNGKQVDAGVLCGNIGSNATLEATYSGTNTDYNIKSDNGNAGGLVGSMEKGSQLTVTASNLQGSTATVTATNGYAGGIVGKNDGGTVTITPSSGTTYSVQQIIHGKNGSGGLFGYYSPPRNSSITLDISKFAVDCKLEQETFATGVAGGIIGKIENAPNSETGGNITIIGNSTEGTSVTSSHETQIDVQTGNPNGYKAASYGGLIGSYQAFNSSYELTVKDVIVSATNSLEATVYGGAIANNVGSSYVKFDTFKLSSAGGTRTGTFGGLVASNPNGYVYADGSHSNTNCTGIVIGVSGESMIDGFTGGGLVGNLGDGILGMTGTINVSNAKPSVADENGHLVGSRDNALVYVDGSWTYSMSDREVDNIGSWGDVIVFDGTHLDKDDVFDSETNHIIKLKSVDTSQIDSAADYALTSIQFQIDSSKNNFITNYTQLALNVGLAFTDDVDLTDTGLRGITRDSGTSNVEYTGSVDGNDHTITFDIKNVGGNDRPVYRKKYVGLISVSNEATFESISFDGSILSKNGRTTKDDTTAYVGTAAATVKSSVEVSDSKTLSTLSITLSGGVSTKAGRLFGEATGSMGNIAISESEFDGNITGNDKCVVGGVIGEIHGGASGATWSFDDVTLKGNVTGVKQIGGLISVLDGSKNATIKIGETTAVKTDGIKVEGSDAEFMGGLFGYEWKNADVVIDDFEIGDTGTDITTVKQTAAGSTAGLACYASGHWTVNKLDLSGIKMETGNAASVGMIVNRGKIGSDGIYLELPSGYDYTLSFATGSAFKSGGVFDEICAYSADSANKIMNNGQGIVSISTYDGTNSSSYKLKMGSTANPDNTNTGLTYQAQTSQGSAANPNTRYYYNLDQIDIGDTSTKRTFANLSTDSEKFMRWGVLRYAATNIQKYFKSDNNDTFSFSASGNYDMRGYSWYPINIDSNAVNIKGTFTFYNEEFTETEGVKPAVNNITNRWKPLDSDQHYMMHNGIFNNANAGITVDGALTLAGTIGALDGTSGTGALVYGTVSGSKTDTSTNITTISCTGTGHSISLDGIRIWNLKYNDNGTEKTLGYAPLLINQASDYVTLNISNVSTTDEYEVTNNGTTTTLSAATSLIGKAGTRAIASNDSTISQGITVTFSNIKLDGRSAEGNSVYDDTRYNTTKSIFTNSTLLEWLIGSSGTYNFEYDIDWGTGTPHNVTYGRELGYTTQGQYPNQELWYQDEKKQDPTTLAYIGKQRYVHPDAAQPDSGSTKYSGFTDVSPYTFLPYVHDVSTKANIDNKSQFKYQLMVNHQPSIKINGCGTYNDPYIISNSADLITISKWLAADTNLNGEIDIDLDGDGWCDAENGVLYQEHVTYTCSSSGGTATGHDSKTATEIRQYLAGAYYQIELSGVTEIELASNSGFLGLGAQDVHFHGVIYGGENGTTITNKTSFPIINYSDGSVVKNLTIVADSTDLNTSGSDKKYKSYIKLIGKKAAYDANENSTYGAVIGRIVGGDNIIDNVQLDLTDLKVWLTDQQQLTPVGGYVGVIINGGLVFKNMTGNISGLTNNANITSNNNLNNTNMLDSGNNTWLFVNPIIGRVINGYAITESSSGYKPREANVTMKNSTGVHNVVKNYSITDIATTGSMLTVDSSNSSINVPNSQSFYIMSLLINSGMGSSSVPLGYSSSYIKRTADYSEIGSTEANSADCDDYDDYAKNDTVSGSAYVISKYISGSGAIGSGNWAIELTGTDDYDLPDGFRGVGNFFKNSSLICLSVNSFEGNGATINQNTKYYYYSDDYASYKPAADEKAGIGLFSCIDYNYTNASFSNFVLTGSVKCDAIDKSTGEHITYNVADTNQNSKQNLSAGMLFGAINNYNPMIDSVALQNIDVRGVRHTGGLIGNLVTTGTYKHTDNKNYPRTLIITNENELNSFGIKVHGAGSTAGLIGRNQNGVIQINLNNCSFDINEIVCECSYRWDNASTSTNDYKSDYSYGVGGFIGICRSGNPFRDNCKIENVKIGNNTTHATVQCTDGGTLFTGGVIGVINRANVDITDCNFYNISVDSNYMSGGLVADCITASTPTVKNTHFYGNKTSSIVGATYSGGFIGNTDERSDGGETFKLQDSGMEGYTIQGSTAGGVIGYRGAKNDNAILQIENFTIIDCTVKASTAAGGLAGEMKHPIQGYNILSENLKIESITSGSTITKGYIVGNNNGNGNSCKAIKITGFSRQETLEEGESSSMVQEMIGGGSSNATNYGTGGYVIFADYLGTASYTESNGTITPGTNSSATFSTMTTTSNKVTPAAPYVTTSPKMNIANKDNVMQFLLSDGVSPLTNADVGRSTQAFAKIYDDISHENKGYYQKQSDNFDTAAEYNAYTSKISSFKTEMGSKLADGIDFPVLVLDKINAVSMTSFINNYIGLLTNTSGYNFVYSGNNTIYSIDVKRVTFNAAGNAISQISGTDCCLKTKNTTESTAQFYIESDNTDTKAATAQFTLIDVQFKDPSYTSKVAYHLYIPCYVRKLLEYDFDIHVDSGTTYDINPYSAITKNNLVENIGTPVTLEFAFSYNRSAEEWTDAVNGGDSLLSNYPKNLLFDNATTVDSGQKPNFPSNTKMVLIDTQNYSKAYYLDGLDNSSFVPNGDFRTLNFSSFSSLDNTSFSPVSFNDLLNVSVASDPDGTLIPGDTNAVVKDTTTQTKYRMATDAEKENTGITKYKATVTFKNQNDTKLSEHYFLTIYTPYSNNDVVYHYVIQANKDLGTNPYPSRITAESENKAVNLYIGSIYRNDVFIDSLKVGGVENAQEITKDDNSIEATLRATIGLTSSGEKNIRSTLSQSSPPDIYQSFLIKLNKDGDIGIAAASAVTVEDYKIGNKPVTSSGLNPSWTSAEYTDIQIPNYIELRNGVPLASSLSEVAENGTLTISAKATIVFDNDKGDITKQFFPQTIAQTQSKYTTFIAYSNIASSAANTSSSNVSSMKDRTVGNVQPQYYTKIEERAILNYDALEIPSEGYLPQLGINANDSKDYKKLPSLIKTVGSYDVENCQSAWESANYLKIEIELKSKADEYTSSLDIFNYLQQSTFKIFNDEIDSADIITTGTTSTKLVYIIDKSKLSHFYNDKVYTIPIDFNVYSGGGSSNHFESDSRQYSNYGVFIRVSMLIASDSGSAVDGTESDSTNNYVKYTNARIYLDKVNANKVYP